MSDKIPGLPISNESLKELFDYLDMPNPPDCTHTFKETKEFLDSNDLPVEPTLSWLQSNGAGCDCEVIFNVEAEWGETVGREYIDED